MQVLLYLAHERVIFNKNLGMVYFSFGVICLNPIGSVSRGRYPLLTLLIFSSQAVLAFWKPIIQFTWIPALHFQLD